MSHKKTLRRFETLARKAGVEVRYESLLVPSTSGVTYPGGLCRVQGRSVIVCEQNISTMDKIMVLIRALKAIGIEIFELDPLVRMLAQKPIS